MMMKTRDRKEQKSVYRRKKEKISFNTKQYFTFMKINCKGYVFCSILFFSVGGEKVSLDFCHPEIAESKYCSSNCYIKQLACLCVFKQKNALPKREFSPFDIFRPFPLTPDNKHLLAVMSLLAFSMHLGMSLGLGLFVARKSIYFVFFSHVIVGRLSVKLRQCFHVPVISEI